jgi:hypothetical protein
MKVVWIQWGGAVAAVALVLLMGVPVRAADSAAGVTGVAAEELGRRSKEAEQSQGAQDGMSDSAVRVLMTYAFTIIPAERKGPDGKVIKTDKSDPNKYFIPTKDARRVIRAATRSAYAEICKLPELGRLNFETLMKYEKARKTWSPEQLVMINALHVFASSYFTGNLKITAKEVGDKGPEPQEKKPSIVSKGGVEMKQEGNTRVITAEVPKCPPEQKQKVTNAINAYVRAAQAAVPKQ